MSIIQVGQKLPSVIVHDAFHETTISIHEVFAGKLGVLVGVPGAFTPNCSRTHLPSFVSRAEDLKSRNVAEIACISINDPFVVAAWGKQQGAEGKVRMLADPTGAFTKAIGLMLDDKELEALLGNRRSKRYVMLIENNIVKRMYVEPDGTSATCTLAPDILADL